MKLIPFIFALMLPFQTEGIEDLLKVDQALRGKDYAKAVKLADEAIAKSPKNERLYYLRGLANSGLRDYASALKDFDNSLILEHQKQFKKIAQKMIIGPMT